MDDKIQVNITSPYMTGPAVQKTDEPTKKEENKIPKVEVASISRSHLSHWRVPVSIRREDDRTFNSYGDLISKDSRSPEDRAEIYVITFKVRNSPLSIEEMMDRLEHRTVLAVSEIEQEEDYVSVEIITWEEQWRDACEMIKESLVRPNKEAKIE